jgi:hypothetical protein
MSNFLRSGEGKDLSLTPGQSIAISTITGTVTADVIAGTAKGTNLLNASTSGGTFGPYASGAVIRVVAGEGANVDYDIGTAPVNSYDQNAKYAFDTTGQAVGLVDPVSGQTQNFVKNYTFATLPAAAANSGVTARITDLANTLWESNGTRWRPVNGRAVIKQLATEYSMSGTAAVKAFECILPAGCVQNGDTLQFRYTLGKNGTSETCSINVRLGTTGAVTDTALSSFGPLATTNISAGIDADYKRLSATSVRKQGNGANNSAFAGQSTAAVNSPVTVSSLDAAASYLTIWMANSAAVETSTLYDCILEIVAGQ